MALNDASQFEYLAQAILEAFPGLQNTATNETYFQFTGAPIAAVWEDGEDMDAYTLANTGPGTLDGFYEPTTTDVAKSYQDFIASIAPTDITTNKQWLACQTQLTTLAKQYSTVSTRASAAFNTWLAQNPSFKPDFAGFSGFDKWLVTPNTPGPGWNDQLSNNLDLQTGVKQEIAGLMTAVDGLLGKAQTAATNPANMSTFVGAGVTRQVPLTTIEDISGAMTAWTAAAPGNYELQVSLHRNNRLIASNAMIPWHLLAAPNVPTTWGSLATGQVMNTSLLVADPQFSIQVMAIGARVFNVSRGPWYDSGWLTASNCTLAKGSSFILTDFFGLRGTLKLIPLSMLVIYKPRVEITVSSATYEQEMSHYFIPGGTITLFGMDFNMGPNVNDLITRDASSQIVKIVLDSYDAPNTVPLLFGVSSQSFYRPK